MIKCELIAKFDYLSDTTLVTMSIPDKEDKIANENIRMESWKESLHPNSIITELFVSSDSDVESFAPTHIITDNLTFHPIFEVDFSRVVKLFTETEQDTLQYYSEPAYSNIDKIAEYVNKKQTQWENNDRFSYVIEYDGELIGKTYLGVVDSMSSYVCGLWLQREYWGNGFSGERADALLHVMFTRLNASVLTVGTHIENKKSRRAIEKYIERYGGSYYGNVPVPKVEWYDVVDDPTTVIRHPEWAITAEDFSTDETGISTTIDGVNYNQIEFES